MAVSKKFLEAASKDANLQRDLDKATIVALGKFLKEKGLEAEAGKIASEVMEKFAEAHGFKAEAMESISEDELEAVAGGVCYCPAVGGGTGNGKQCACVLGGTGRSDSGTQCTCPIVGAGKDD